MVCVRGEYIFFILHVDIQFLLSRSFVEKTIFPLTFLGSMIENQLTKKCGWLFLNLKFYYIDLYLFLQVDTLLFDYVALQQALKLGCVSPSKLLFLKFALAILSPFYFLCRLGSVCNFYKETSLDFDRDYVRYLGWIVLPFY